LQIIINIFTITGSSLGIIAFIISIVNPIQVHNKSQWTKLNKLLNLKDLEQLCDGVSFGVVYQEPNSRLRELINLIKNDYEDVQFKGYTGKRIKQKLQKIGEAADRFYDEVQVPNWDYVKNNPEHIDKQLNKIFIRKKGMSPTKGDEKIHAHLKAATREIEAIVELYRSVYKMSNKLPMEYLYKK
jgi:hypothetical protein